ncbi:MAG: hypothetical protein ABL878_20680, partial [Burkholderiales bacterium]
NLNGSCQRINSHRPVPHCSDGIDEERDGRNVVKVRMRDEDMVDERKLGQGQITEAGAGIDQDVLVDQKRGRPEVTPADATGAA